MVVLTPFHRVSNDFSALFANDGSVIRDLLEIINTLYNYYSLCPQISVTTLCNWSSVFVPLSQNPFTDVWPTLFQQRPIDPYLVAKVPLFLLYRK